VIQDNSTITLHFSLALENGDIVDSTFEKSPATFTFGDGSLLPSIEKRLLGLMVGTKETFKLLQEEAFGAKNPQNIQRFKPSDFSAEKPEEGMMFNFADAAGGELPGVVKSVSDELVEIDFNHPLAGHELTFKVEIIDVK
jgi:FKBP-type peptidyl-prolyl cis-trans isomerase SlpA